METARQLYLELRDLAHNEYPHVITDWQFIGGTFLAPRILRLRLRDNSFLDVRVSGTAYAFHWERRAVDGTLYRWDNAPHHPEVATFPHHVHFGAEATVVASEIPAGSIHEALRYVLRSVAELLENPRR